MWDVVGCLDELPGDGDLFERGKGEEGRGKVRFGSFRLGEGSGRVVECGNVVLTCPSLAVAIAKNAPSLKSRHSSLMHVGQESRTVAVT